MQLTVLGCHSPFPAPDGATPGYLITTKSGKQVLLDCGSGVLSQLIKYIPPYDLDMVILSHLHHDHIADFFVLQYAIMVAIKQGWRTKPLQIYAPIKPLKWSKNLYYGDYIDVRELNEKTWTELDEDTTVRSYRTNHSVPCYALEIQDQKHIILYGADSGYETNWNQMKKNPDVFICEATYLESDMPANAKDHLSTCQAGEIANLLNAKHLVVTHLFPFYDRDDLLHEVMSTYKGFCDLAQTGFILNLK
ncbi:MBL fold metallo-hydrolase [Shimazuella kribbensis]|uniref:MBL fold metallo-hydrolase n=1 Tax=Shimazuella kribbensis TaxID=139808 RepID=UPI00040DC8F2|nr:MBL fold metallo-hydrolase [Shimazuella kribbensis]